MVKLTVELPDDLAAWLAERAAGRRVSRQDLIVEMARNEYELSLAFEEATADAMRKHHELLQRLASWPRDPSAE